MQQGLNMRDQILKIINTNPKHYQKLIKKDSRLMEWVNTNTLIDSEYLPEKIYSAIFQKTNICKNGNVKKFDRFSTGFVGCGPAKDCECTRSAISDSVSSSKKRWSLDTHLQVNDRRKQTMIKKYGKEFNSQRDEIKSILSRPKIPIITHEKLLDKDWLDQEYNIKQRSLSEIAMQLGVYYSTVGEYCKKLGFTIRPTSLRSIEEVEICEFIRSLGIDVEESNRTILLGKELDIYIPSKKIAIEVNGLYWHSYSPSTGKKEDRTRHIKKTQLSKSSGISLIHITDFEWNTKRDQIKSLLLSKLGMNKRISARNCSIELINKQDEKQFLETYHLQGSVRSMFSVGLYYKTELLMIITVGKSRFSKSADYEILRMCTKSGITVVGGISKLLSEIKKKLSGSKIISYCDLSKGSGNGYESAGFSFVNNTGPGYFWTNGTNVVSRYKCQKKQLSKWLKSFDREKSESINLFDAGYRRYWDCGNAIYIITA